MAMLLLKGHCFAMSPSAFGQGRVGGRRSRSWRDGELVVLLVMLGRLGRGRSGSRLAYVVWCQTEMVSTYSITVS
jgi:hypothetical protein